MALPGEVMPGEVMPGEPTGARRKPVPDSSSLILATGFSNAGG